MHEDLPQLDVVEALLEAHREMRQAVTLARAVTAQSATDATQVTAARVAHFIEWSLPMHQADEEQSIAPRLTGRNRTVDAALEQMAREHFALQAPLSRLRVLCGLVARDISRLHHLRFELDAALNDLALHLERHQAFEESAIFPALKRLLYVDELDGIAREMRERRSPLAA